MRFKQANYKFFMRDSTGESECAFRCDCYLPKAFKVHKLVKVIYDPEHRMKWEANHGSMVVYDKKERVPNSNTLLYETYSKGKKMFGVAERDFYEKGVCLWDGERYFNYTSSICHPDNGGTPIPAKDRCPEGAVRALSTFSLVVISRET